MSEQFSEHITNHETQTSHGFGVSPENYGKALHKKLAEIQNQEKNDTLNDLQQAKNEQKKQIFLNIQQELVS